ncbi:capsule biosynthesis protein [Roseomonas sp. NAR14]|uniref:Capsule biosynthesis protein n=1 Tax=Roseomonas acroporae TaxID=2937791 RepID=A0A9X1Y6R2_9PROT|nr:capsule biosynthesis protein [Roseomonas acroporae]MCK8784593.1 capsule biosynthesis protein [Roseomonas acroporae]
MSTHPAPPLLAAAPTRRALPHLAGFWPGRAVLAAEAVRHPPAGAEFAVLAGTPGEARRLRRAGAAGLRLAPGPWQPTRFAGRALPVALLAAPAGADPLALALDHAAGAEPAARADGAALMAALRQGRVGGAAGWPDPGAVAAGAVLLLDPCRPVPDPAALLRAVQAAAAGRPVLVARSPRAPRGAAPAFAALPAGIGRLEAPEDGAWAPWALVEGAAALHLADADDTALAALAAGVPVHAHADAPWTGRGATIDAPGLPRRAARRDAEALFAALAAATRCADPFSGQPCGRPWTLAEAVAQLAEWRRVEAANRRVAVCCGMTFWKRRRIAAAFATEAGPPPFRRDAAAALAEARRRGGAVAVWATRMPAGLEAGAAAAGTPLLRVEDGFVRSAGLGAAFMPGASLAVDASGVHYDPSGPSDLETLLATARFDAALLRRAAALRDSLVARGVTKYNLGGTLPPLGAPPGRRIVLVPGQVEDDAAIRRGGAPVRTNLALLEAVRAAAPDAFLLYKPHPDVEAGQRLGRVPPGAALRLADRVLDRVPMAALLDAVDEVHTISSLSGFEALLRGRRVATYGLPFYAGWGLTEDRVPPAGFPRRGRRLGLLELLAGTLILYPRYVDPVTELPCPVEVILERIAQPEAWRPVRAAPLWRWQQRFALALAGLRGAAPRA